MSLLTANTFENLNFKFIELRKLSVAKKLSTNVVNNLAISHNHQAIFAAYENAFKVIKISTLLDFEFSKNVINQIVDSYPAIEIKLPFNPSLLSVSGGSNNLLLVFGQNPSNILTGDIYDIPSLLTNNLSPINRIEFPTSISLNVHLKSVAWHPEFSESLFAAALSNGALVTFGIDLQTKGVQLLSQYSDSFKFTCVSWSPKGKQLVVGGENGQLTQFKHQNGKNFTKAKIIQLPKELPNHKIINVNWVHSALFQVACVHNSSTSNPDTRIIFVHASPKATPEFYDFGSVCMETSQYGGPDKIQVNFSEIGNVLLCLTSISSEVAVIGCEAGEVSPAPVNWSQWILDDTSRIELQPDSQNMESSPCGVAWFKGPTKIFRVNESVSFGGPGWPLVVILSSAGILCPYYAYHFQGKLVVPDFPPSQALPINVPPPLRVNRSDMYSAGQQLVSQIPLSKSTTQPFQSQQSQSVDATFTFSLPSQDKHKPQSTVSVAATVQAPVQQQVNQMSQQQSQISQQQQSNQVQKEQLKIQQQVQQSVQQPQNYQQTSQTFQPSTSEQVPKSVISEEELRKKEEEVMEETFSVAISEEIADFTKNLQNVKNNFSKALNLQIGKPDELAILQSDTASLTELLKTSSETLKSFDLNMLNGYLLETWAMVQEATTRLEKESDPVYTMLANRRSLDPITARKMREIKKMAHDIEMQLEDFNSMLDREWEEYAAKMGSKNPTRTLSSIDMIYHTLSTHHKTIGVLKKSLAKYDKFSKTTEFEDDTIVSPRRKEIQEIINSLKNTTIQDDGSMNESSHLKSIFKIPTVTKEKKEKLLEFFEQRTTVPIRRAILPVDLKSSKMVSAVVKAKERLKEIRAKTTISKTISPSKPVDSQSPPKSTDPNATLSLTQVTPDKLSERAEKLDDKSLFYTTAVGDISICDASRYQSPSKTLGFLSPITTKNDPKLSSKSQPVSDISHFKEPEPADKSTPFVGKTNSKTELKDYANLSFSFSSTTIGNIASPPSSSTFLFGSSKPIGTEKSFASTFASATKDISIIAEPTKEVPSSTKEAVQSKDEIKETKQVTLGSSSTQKTSSNSTVTPAQSTTVSSEKATTFPTFAFSSSQVTSSASSIAPFSFKTTTTFPSFAPTTSAPISSSQSIATTAPSSGSLFGGAPASPAPFSLSSSAPFNLSTQSTKDAVPVDKSISFLNNTSLKTEATNDNSFSLSFTQATLPNPASPSSSNFPLDSTAKPSEPEKSATLPFSLTTQDNSNKEQSKDVPTSTARETSQTKIEIKETKPLITSSSIASPSSLSTVTTITPVSTITTTTPPLATTSITSVTAPISSEATSTFPAFTFSSSQPTSTASSTAPFSFSTSATSVAALSPFGAATSTNAAASLAATTTPASGSLFGGNKNTSAFFTPSTPSSFNLSSQPTDVISPKTNEPAPAFNFNAALANLGGQPSQDATKNPFGTSITSPAPQLNLFSSTTQTPSFGTPASMSSSFASQGPAVAQTGFGIFSTQAQPRFGAQPTFGGAPAFGTQPTFGGSPTFGTGMPFGKSISGSNLGFGQATVAPSVAKPAEATSPFAGFANANAPSFGALASQQAPTFGQLAATTQVPVQQNPSTGSLFGGFGQTNISGSPSIFGNTFSSAPAFGSPQFSQRRQ